MAPSLLYHSTNPTLYPTNNADETLLVIRFNGPTRINNVRIIPEGVESLGGIGTTYPPSFSGQILLNVSPSNPVNALTSTTINVVPSENPLDYPINMPIGVTTRMMMFYSSAQKLTISVYGYSGDSLNISDPQPIGSFSSHEIHNQSKESERKEDYSWIYSWAGSSLSSLLDLLNDSVPQQISNRAMECLDLHNTIQPIFPLLLSHQSALSYIMSHPSSLRESILSNPEYALHPSMCNYLPPDHPLRTLIQPSTTLKHQQAWNNLGLGLGPLLILQDLTEDELLNVENGQDKSNLIRLVEISRGYLKNSNQNSINCLENIINILNREYKDRLLNNYLARTLPRLIVVLNSRSGTKKELELPLEYAQDIVTSLIIIRSEIIDGKSAKLICDELSKRYIEQLDEDDILKKLSHNNELPSPVPQSISNDEDSRRLNRLSQSLNTSLTSPNPTIQTPQISLIHTITQSELLSLISPNLHMDLSNSKQPLFGIKSNLLSNDIEQGTKSFAGKVYSQHEFRRDRNNIQNQNQNEGGQLGLGISNLSSTSAMGGMGGMGGSGGMGNMGGLGIGSSGGGGGRAASRHVDSYSRG